ncbi:unnamed protein product [Rotaria sordida]|uniref:Uncharacterized protein n=1 Tax=Rotaria sordida TaxID=392033 RepID=A0A815J685_9BILA|nr:unnamed protein product [Rotaria sordida]CAF1376251.1 unnamed protein product [Rotaria sordida]CAF3822954.1 unnamed protein product [Rotaria sordida]CAF3945692.1 unnamed protein product [Rotaria sordida]
MIRILFILCLIFLIEINAKRHRCINSGVLFSDKIIRSPIIVYGQSLAKRIHLETNTELLFNITFRVDCIFKGQDIENQIEITEAGIKFGHTACQWLEPGQRYIVFLEKWGININSYRPLDFQELIVDNMTYELLEKTCHLTRISPLHSTINKCPNVSISEYCPHDDIDVSVTSSEEYSNDINFNIKPSYFDDDNIFYRQANVTIIKYGSIITDIEIYSKNYAYSLTINWILMIIIIIVLIMII